MTRMVRRTLATVLVVSVSCFCLGQAQEKVLYSFGANANDGFLANGGLLFDKQGNIFGTTFDGGGSLYGNQGTAFELSQQRDGTWAETIIYNFCSVLENNGFCADGARPEAGLIADSAGNLYGTTFYGGVDDQGTVFELSPPVSGATWVYTKLYEFLGSQSNGAPAGKLTWDGAGNLYGTFQNGVFEMTPNGGGGWNYSTLVTFCPNYQNCTNGVDAVAGVSFDKAGNLYGTTYYGGIDSSWGVLYKLSPTGGGNWNETVLYDFRPRSGARPISEVNFDAEGNLYFTSSMGMGAGQCGSVDRFNTKTNTIQKYLFDYNDPITGCDPYAGVLLNRANGAAYGTSAYGGQFSTGNVYKATGDGKVTSLYTFCQLDNCADGEMPTSSLTEDSHGNLYGVTFLGGANNKGVVFEITP